MCVVVCRCLCVCVCWPTDLPTWVREGLEKQKKERKNKTKIDGNLFISSV